MIPIPDWANQLPKPPIYHRFANPYKGCQQLFYCLS